MGSIEMGKDNSGSHKRRLEAAIEKALTMIGGVIESAAKEQLTANGSVDTGLLRNSITYALGGEYPAAASYTNNAGSKDKAGREITGKQGTYEQPAPADTGNKRTVYVGTNVEYAPYVELGTSRMGAKPYLRPAVENNKRKIEKAIEISFRGL